MSKSLLIGTPRKHTADLYNYINERKQATLIATNVFMYKQCIDYFLTKSNKSLTNQNPETLQIEVYCTAYVLSKILINLPEGVQCNTH